jgi:hypothetical protein
MYLYINCHLTGHCGVKASQSLPFLLLKTTKLLITYSSFFIRIPNVLLEWLALLFRFLEISVSNLGSETGYPNWGYSLCYSYFFSVPTGKFRDVP